MQKNSIRTNSQNGLSDFYVPIMKNLFCLLAEKVQKKRGSKSTKIFERKSDKKNNKNVHSMSNLGR